MVGVGAGVVMEALLVDVTAVVVVGFTVVVAVAVVLDWVRPVFC